MPRPLVSVVIPTRNRPALLKEALESVRAQTYPHWEAIVVDDGSETPASEALGGPDVRFLRQPRTLGVSAARNRGISAARGEIVAFLDDDDLWLPGWLEAGVRALAEHPEAGMVRGQRRERNVKTGRSLPILPLPAGFNAVQSLLDHGCGSPSATMIRKACLARVGGFDESLSVDEDLDLFLRVGASFRCFTLAEELVVYRVHGDNVSARAQRLADHIAYHERLLARPPRGLTSARVRFAIYYWRCVQIEQLVAEGGSPQAPRLIADALRFWIWNPRHWRRGALLSRSAQLAIISVAGIIKRRGWPRAARGLYRLAGLRPPTGTAFALWREHSIQNPRHVSAR